MHVLGGLGFSGFVVVAACLVFPVFYYVIRRKWQLELAKKEEIKQLLILASEEAARAELEAEAEAEARTGATTAYPYAASRYDEVSVVPRDVNQCAFCFAPTKKHCSRCKAVKYCSGKCQIIHWRQGHKDECHPPPTPYRDKSAKSSLKQKVAEKKLQDLGGKFGSEDKVHLEPIEISSKQAPVPNLSTSFDDSYSRNDNLKAVKMGNEDKTHPKPGEISSRQAPVSDPCISCDDLHRTNDNLKAEDFTDNKRAISPSEYMRATSSKTANELSDGVPGIESISPTSTERLKKHMSANAPTDLLKQTSGHVPANAPDDLLKETAGVNNNDQTKTPSPKFASLFSSVHSVSDLSKSDHNKSSCDDVEGAFVLSSPRLESSGSRTADRKGKLTSQSLRKSSDFWERAIDSIESRHDTQDGSSFDKVSSDTRCPPLSSSNLPQNAAIQSCPVGFKPNDCVSGEGSPGAQGTVLAGSTGIDAPGVAKKPTDGCDMPMHMDAGTHGSSPEISSTKVKSATSVYSSVSSVIKGCSVSTKASSVHKVSSSGSRKAGPVANDASEISMPTSSSKKVDSSISTSSASTTSCLKTSMRIYGECSSRVMSSEMANHSTSSKSSLRTSAFKLADESTKSKLPKHHPVGVEGETGRRGDKGLFPYEMFVRLYTSNNPDLRPFGLINCGNSCYANAVLQCLVFTPPLTAYFLQGLHSKTCTRKDWCFTCDLERLVLNAKEGVSPLSPIRIMSQLKNIGCHLGDGKEEDAHEFLRYAIETMQSVCLADSGIHPPASVEEETTLIGLTFGGYLISKIKCTKCKGKSERRERMMDLTVEIDGDIGTLEEALQKFTGTEILDGENKYHCSRCKSYERAKKKLRVLEAPNVLTIALKRYQSGQFGKLNKPVRFPEILNMAPYMSDTSDTSPIYRLYAVIVHLDVMNAAFSGHYVCYVKNIQNKWFKADDSNVTAVELEKVFTKDAYMLLYARCSPRAPKLLRKRVVCPDVKTRVFPVRGHGNDMSMKPGHARTHPSVLQSRTYLGVLDHPGSFNLYLGQRPRTLEEESSSDSSSLISSNSDESSCSTDSTRDSVGTNDFSDNLFGDPGQSWSSPSKSGFATDSSSSPNTSSLL